MGSSAKRILGVDPGTFRLGVGFIDKAGSEIRLISAHVIEPHSRLDIYGRLGVIVEELDRLIAEFRPTEVAIENPFFAKNAKSAFQLGLARGVAITLCLKQAIRIFEYSPTQVKSTVTGDGRADKAQVKKMVGLTLKASIDLKYDATDALAVALCHAHTSRWVLEQT